ncbi:histidine kinase [Paenibacillus pasadenensis]|uniref:sensor histidine kinase n=1 Tax=Paenibacillus pasadenensis TaxID=217090 RepID=UPI002040CAB9|nr:histidine kinase [Paenibacillus pasadenensis]MCM3745739.1 histidine kinase [Paenibacillus pasadenensis]
MWGNKWRFGIFKRLLVSFLIALTPLYALGFYMYEWSKNEIKEEITASAQAQANYYINDMQNRLNQISAMQYELLGDPYVVQLANSPESLESYDKIGAMLYIRARLQSVMNSSPWIKDVRLLVPHEQLRLSASDGLDTMEQAAFNTSRLSSPYRLVHDAGELFMEAASPLIAYGSTSEYRPDFIVEIELSADALKQDMNLSNERSYSGKMSLTLGDGFGIQSSFEAPEREGDYITVQARSADYDMTYIQWILKDSIYESLNRHVRWFWIFSILTLSAAALFLLDINRIIRLPLAKIVRAFRNVEAGNFNLPIHHRRDDEFNYIYDRFNQTMASVRQLIDQVYKQKILLQDAELKQLQSQINPHFLYNSLFMTVRLIKSEKLEQASDFVHQLAGYFRFVTRNAKDTVSLADEIAHSRNYAGIQQVRFHDRISILFEETPAQWKDMQVPRLILQPLIENAFVHALEDKIEGGLLRVSFQVADNGLQIAVEDNGDHAEEQWSKLYSMLNLPQHDAEVTAVLNVHRRLQVKMGPSSGLAAERSELGGIKMVLTLTRAEENNDPVNDRG